MALPKGVKSPVDYTKLYMSQVLDGEPINEKALSKKQQRFFGIVRAIQKGEQEPTTPETAKAAADMKKSDVKKYASTKHTKLPEKIEEKLDKDDKPFVKKLVGKLRKGSKTHAKQADDLEKAMNEGLGGTGPKTAPSSEDMKKKQFAKEPLTQQSLDARKSAQANVTGKMNQLGGITKTNTQNGKLTSMSIQGVGAGTNKDALAAMLPSTGLKMDADGNLPDVGAAVQQKAIQGMKTGQNTMSKNPTKFTSSQKQDFNTAKNYATSGQIKTDVNRQIAGTQQFRLDIGADEVNLATQKFKPKTNKGFKLGMQKEDITDEALTIQDWNSDDIKFTEIETVDIIKAKPLKENKLIDFVRNIGKTDFNKEKERIDKVFGPPPGSIDSDGNKVPDPKGILDKNKKKKPNLPKVKIKSLKDFEKEAIKLRTEQKSNWRDELEEDWQKVNRKDKTDGLSKAAVKAYRRENPGSKLQTAVTTKPSKLKKGSKSAKRRLSFCRRMKGMKKKLTSAKTRRDPDSRINKALRRWNC